MKKTGEVILNTTLTSLVMVIFGCGNIPTQNYDELAKCITSKDTVIYGAFWCGNCSRQKELFGGSFKYIKYIECDPRGENSQAGLCAGRGVSRYPTWEFSDKSKTEGVMPLENLAKKTNCKLPAQEAPAKQVE